MGQMRPKKNSTSNEPKINLEDEIISSENHQDNFDQFENDNSTTDNNGEIAPITPEPQPKPIIDERVYADVEVESRIDYTLPYKQRRTKWGMLLFLGAEMFYPSEYSSVIMTGENGKFRQFSNSKMMTLGSVELGAKYNTLLGSFGLLGGFAGGQISNPDLGLTSFNISIYKVGFNFAMDNVFIEPYVVPYVQGGVHVIDYKETSVVANIESEEGQTTDPIYHFRAGLLFQLNWLEKKIDPNTHYNGLVSSGLENTFIDVFYSYYAQPLTVAEAAEQDGDPDFESSEYGVGLKMEF